MMQSASPDQHDHVTYEAIEPPISVSHFARVLHAYRGIIALSLIAVGLSYAIVAIAIYLMATAQRVTSLPFRLDFKGATEGKYPNGTKFSTNDIINTPILLRVYQQNRLQKYVSFPKFAKAIFIVEQNREYERLQAEYQARLSDTKLSPVDRERIEKEFDAKRQALSKNDYAISYLAADNESILPRTVTNKVLADVLRDWANQAVHAQRSLLYDIPMLSARFVDLPVVDPTNYLAALQLLRVKITQVRQNLAELSNLPGANLVRTSSEASLEELRLQLDDLLRFRVEPFMTLVRSSGLIANSNLAIQFLESQLAYDERQLRVQQQKADAVREALATYTRTESNARPAESAPAGPDPTRSPADVVMPQLSDTFIERLLDMTNRGADQQYRQKLTDALREETTNVIPIQEAVDFDRQLLNAIRQGTPKTSNLSASEATAQIEGMRSELRELITQTNEIYRMVSANLNPSTVLFTLAGPPSTRMHRSVQITKLALVGLLVLLISFPVIVGLAFLHNRIREEEKESAGPGSVTA